MAEYKGAGDTVTINDVLEAVSYTHLDVYKRQDINKALAEFIKSDKYQELKTKWGA